MFNFQNIWLNYCKMQSHVQRVSKVYVHMKIILKYSLIYCLNLLICLSLNYVDSNNLKLGVRMVYASR